MMRAKLPVILAGAAAAILAAAATPATAGSDDTHILTVRLPNGMVEQIQYNGDVAPRIVVSPVPAPVLAAVPVFDPAPEWATPFAALARISALLDRQEAAMLQQAAQGPGMAAAMPRGFTGFSMVTTITSDGSCQRSMQVTYLGGDAQPHTVSKSSGNCDTQPAVPVPAQLGPAAPPPWLAPAPAPATIEVKAHDRAPGPGLVHQALWQN
jgi:hypothetical protein